MSANIKASVDGTQAIIGVGGVDQMTVSNAGVVTANSFVGNVTGGGTFSGNASSATALATGSTTARTLANRFADVVNVLDFGAVGDGVTDDSAAIQAALDVGGTIHFPSGFYLINSRIQCSQSNIDVDFGTAIFLNTIQLPIVVVYSQDTNAMFDFTGNSIKITGGKFKDCLSECIRITGSFISGNTFSGIGYTKDHRINNIVFENCEGNSCNIRFFENAIMENLIVRKVGMGSASGHQPELGFSYGTLATISSCQVRSSRNGGGAYFLYVNAFVCQGNIFENISNLLNGQSVVAIYASQSQNGSSNGNIVDVIGGTGLKYSYGCTNMSVCSNTIAVSGTSTADQYAAIFLQGVDGFLIDGNNLSNVGNHVIRLSNHTTPANLNTKNGVVSNNRCITTYGLGYTNRINEGDGIYISSLTSVDRGSIDIIGNRFNQGNIYILQSRISSISNNMLSNTDSFNPYLSTSGAIFIDRCSKCFVESNNIVDDTTTGTRYGLRVNSSAQTFIYDNVVQYDTGSGTGATSFFQEGTPTQNRWVENIPLNAATSYSGIGTAQAVQTQIIRSLDTFDMASVPADSTITFTRTLANANIGDIVVINALGSTGTPQDSIIFNSYITSTNTITIIASNNTSSAIDLSSRDYNILLFKQAIF